MRLAALQGVRDYRMSTDHKGGPAACSLLSVYLSTAGDRLLNEDEVWLKPACFLYACLHKLVLLRDERVQREQAVLPVVLQRALQQQHARVPDLAPHGAVRQILCEDHPLHNAA